MTTRIVVAGTDTDIGKTVFAAGARRTLSTGITGSRCRQGFRAKPILRSLQRLSGLRDVAHSARILSPQTRRHRRMSLPSVTTSR